ISLKKMQPKPGKSFYEWCIEKNKEYLLDEWDTENNDNNPRDYKYASDRSVNWVCSVCGHRWTSSIKNRTLANSGCTKCGVETVRKCRMTPKKGESLAEVLPKVAEEWHPTKNSKLTPKDVKYGSAREFYWLCPRCGEEWKDSVCHRLMGRSCPNCSKHRRVSFNEKAIYVGLKKTFPEIEMIENYRNKPCGITEIDIFIPSISLGIEYDGRRHHQYLEKDLKKDRACKENGIKLIRVKEYFSTYFGPTPDYWIYKSGSEKELTDVIKKIEKLIAIRCGIEKYKSKCDVKKNRIEIYDCIIQYDSKNKLSVDYPEIAKEWHPTKNGKTKPEFVSSKTHRKYWWKCSVCGHEWEAKVENRTVNKSGCPECKKQKRIV
ncbi:MAG: zinc-ribbon domain-containing protein, partial [Paludibacteraceae bacterium]|nr:zinc-ribbon domain-containing protein [Paludibacteraceae bacterium]